MTQYLKIHGIQYIYKLFEEYGEEVVSLEFRNYPIERHDPYYYAAQASECVLDLEDEEAFFEYIDILFDNKEDNYFAFLIEYAVDVGIDSSDMRECLSTQEFLPEVLDDLQDGKDLKIFGTPTFIINGELYKGKQSYEIFEEIVEENIVVNENEEDNEDETGDNDDNEEEEIDEEETEDEKYECINGCLNDDKCIPYGSRLLIKDKNKYCSLDGDLVIQKEEGASCQNNYECLSNQCSNGKCIDLDKKLEETNNIIDKLINFLKGLFGK